MIIMKLLGKPYHCIQSMLLLIVFVKPLLLVELNGYVVMVEITKAIELAKKERAVCYDDSLHTLL